MSFIRVEYDDFLLSKLIDKNNINNLTRSEIKNLVDDA